MLHPLYVRAAITCSASLPPTGSISAQQKDSHLSACWGFSAAKGKMSSMGMMSPKSKEGKPIQPRAMFSFLLRLFLQRYHSHLGREEGTCKAVVKVSDMRPLSPTPNIGWWRRDRCFWCNKPVREQSSLPLLSAWLCKAMFAHLCIALFLLQEVMTIKPEAVKGQSFRETRALITSS